MVGVTISDQEVLMLLGEKVVELHLANKANRDLAAALQAAKSALEEAQEQRPNGDTAE